MITVEAIESPKHFLEMIMKPLDETIYLDENRRITLFQEGGTLQEVDDVGMGWINRDDEDWGRDIQELHSRLKKLGAQLDPQIMEHDELLGDELIVAIDRICEWYGAKMDNPITLGNVDFWIERGLLSHSIPIPEWCGVGTALSAMLLKQTLIQK
jgi:hypothetical protein